jgi:hypothetical protein
MASQIEQVSGEALPITLDDHVMVHTRRRSNVSLLSLFALQYDGQCPEAITTVNGSSKDAKAQALIGTAIADPPSAPCSYSLIQVYQFGLGESFLYVGLLSGVVCVRVIRVFAECRRADCR